MHPIKNLTGTEILLYKKIIPEKHDITNVLFCFYFSACWGLLRKLPSWLGNYVVFCRYGHCKALWMIGETKLEPLRHNIMTEHSLTKLI